MSKWEKVWSVQAPQGLGTVILRRVEVWVAESKDVQSIPCLEPGHAISYWASDAVRFANNPNAVLAWADDLDLPKGIE